MTYKNNNLGSGDLIMSLTSMLKGKNEKEVQLQEILKKVAPTKDMFKTASGKKAFSNEYEVITPNILETTYQSAVVGNAFDYLMRFEVAKNVNCNKQEVLEKIVAEYGLKILERFADKKTYAVLTDKYGDTIKTISSYVLGNTSNEKDLILASCYLARLDSIYRSGMPPMDIKASLIDDEAQCVVKDLEMLFDIFKDDFIRSGILKSNSDVVFNPTFGPLMSMFVGGADADIFIDGILYDIKTTKNNGFKWQDSAQLIGYYLLNELARDLEDIQAPLTHREIYRIAFYKPRFSEIEYIDINDIDLAVLKQAITELKDMTTLTYMS